MLGYYAKWDQNNSAIIETPDDVINIKYEWQSNILGKETNHIQKSFKKAIWLRRIWR